MVSCLFLPCQTLSTIELMKEQHVLITVPYTPAVCFMSSRIASHHVSGLLLTYNLSIANGSPQASSSFIYLCNHSILPILLLILLPKILQPESAFGAVRHERRQGRTYQSGNVKKQTTKNSAPRILNTSNGPSLASQVFTKYVSPKVNRFLALMATKASSLSLG